MKSRLDAKNPLQAREREEFHRKGGAKVTTGEKANTGRKKPSRSAFGLFGSGKKEVAR